MNKLLLLLSLCFLIACSTEKTSDTEKLTASKESKVKATGTSAASTASGNAPPELRRVRIMPEVFKPEDKLYIDAEAGDVDGDDVSVVFEWTLNGEPAGSAREINSEVKRGDRISVKATPYDGETYGRPITLHREIRNLPPMLAKENKSVFDGKTFTYQINAVDPDGDDIAYTLKEGPAGMTIGSESGIITWEAPPGYAGNQNVKLLISDNHGGELLVSFTVKITHNP